MQRLHAPTMCGLLFAILLLPALAAQENAKQDTKPDPDVLAKKLIGQCARVGDGDMVLISGGARDRELLESLMVEAAKVGPAPW
jgi:hypothetical protein